MNYANESVIRRSLFRAISGLWMYYFLRGNLALARQLAERQFAHGEHSDDLSERLNAHQFMISTLTHCGEISAVGPYIERCLIDYSTQKCAHFTELYGQDVGVAAHCYAAWSLWFHGYPDQAEQQSNAALELARQLDYPVNQAFALSLSAMLYQFRGETEKVQTLAEAAFNIALEYDYAQWLGMSVMLQGWVKAQRGEHQAGIAQIQQGLAGWRASGSRLSMPHNLLLLAEALLAADRLEQALQTIDEAWAMSQETGEHFLDAELQRFKGELLLRCRPQKNYTAAEICLQNAITIATRQQNKAWCLRALLGLFALYQETHKKQRVYRQLKALYQSFSEGSATPDLRHARRILYDFEHKLG